LVNSSEHVIICPQNCGKSYKNMSSLKKHLKYECNKAPQFQCLFCNKRCKRPDNLRKHMQLVHCYVRKIQLSSNCNSEDDTDL